MRILLKHCNIIDAVSKFDDGIDILIDSGRIVDISHDINASADKIIDASGYKVMPGFIDMHTHLREPGYEHKETVLTGTKAAARGGYTTICCMPNTKPVIDDVDSLELLKDVIERDACINVYPIAAITKGQMGQELSNMYELKLQGAIAFSDDGHPVSSIRVMSEALRYGYKHDVLLIEHCEDLDLVAGGVINRGAKSDELGLKGISVESETQPIARDVIIAKDENARLHIAHISTEKSAAIIKKAKEMGAKVTCEVTPHHIALTEDIIREGYTDCKVNPPLRTYTDTIALIDALKEDIIDVIATDHAPHSKEDKKPDFYKAAFGISGIETAFTVCYTTLVKAGALSLRKLVEKMSYNPARILGLDKGRITVGACADIAIVDTESCVLVDSDKFESKGHNTPFNNRSYYGEVICTICNGKLAYYNKS